MGAYNERPGASTSGTEGHWAAGWGDAWKVQTSSVALVELLMMNSQSWKISEKSLLNDSLSFLALAEVISSREKSKTSSERSLRICAREAGRAA